MSRIVVRKPDSIYQADGRIVNGTFHGRWHFSFDMYFDPEYMQFGTLRVFNDDTLSPGAVWPLHPHSEIEVVTYCAGGQFRHEDEHGKGGILKKGWVQHTTVGKSMMHSEINNSKEEPMRFIQMWFIPSERGLEPSVEQKAVKKEERTNRLLPLVSNKHPGTLPIASDAEVYSCFLEKGNVLKYQIKDGRGAYLYVLEGGTVKVDDNIIPTFGTAKAIGKLELTIQAEEGAELLLVDVLLI
jgi:redox-sensitive bicupin YhaK (pirin superfamily)